MLTHIGLMAQASGNTSSAGGAVGAIVALLFVLVELALVVLMIAGLWKTFSKAGQPGWAAIVPFYNLYILVKVAGRPGWWLVLLLIPFVSLVIIIILGIDIARHFGKGTGFGVGLALLGFIFFPILGFGDAVYQADEGPRGFAVMPVATH